MRDTVLKMLPVRVRAGRRSVSQGEKKHQNDTQKLPSPPQQVPLHERAPMPEVLLNQYHPELRDEVSASAERVFQSGTDVGMLAGACMGSVEIPFAGLTVRQVGLEDSRRDQERNDDHLRGRLRLRLRLCQSRPPSQRHPGLGGSQRGQRHHRGQGCPCRRRGTAVLRARRRRIDLGEGERSPQTSTSERATLNGQALFLEDVTRPVRRDRPPSRRVW